MFNLLSHLDLAVEMRFNTVDSYFIYVREKSKDLYLKIVFKHLEIEIKSLMH